MTTLEKVLACLQTVDEKDVSIQSEIDSAIKYAESFQYLPRDYYKTKVMPSSTEQAVVMLAAHFCKTQKPTKYSDEENTVLKEQLWNMVNKLLKLNKKN